MALLTSQPGERRCAVIVTYESAAHDVQASAVIATQSAFDSSCLTSFFALLYNSGTHFLVKCCLLGILYLGSNVFNMSRKS